MKKGCKVLGSYLVKQSCASCRMISDGLRRQVCSQIYTHVTEQGRSRGKTHARSRTEVANRDDVVCVSSSRIL